MKSKTSKEVVEFAIPAEKPGLDGWETRTFATKVSGPNLRDSIYEYRKLLELDRQQSSSFNLTFFDRETILNVTAYDNPDDSISMVGTLALRNERLTVWKRDLNRVDIVKKQRGVDPLD